MPGAVKVTVMPLSGFRPESVTLTESAVAKAVPTRVLCGVPAVAVRTAGGPKVLVRLNVLLNTGEAELAVDGVAAHLIVGGERGRDGEPGGHWWRP